MPVSLEEIHAALRTGQMSELIRTHGKPGARDDVPAANVSVNVLREERQKGQTLSALNALRTTTASRAPVEHAGPWRRRLLEDLKNPGHQREIYYCHGNCETCPAHAQEALDGSMERAELLTTTTIYLEEHKVQSEEEGKTIQRAIGRKDGVSLVIRLEELDLRIISTVPVSGRSFSLGTPLQAGVDRVLYVNELLARAPRSYRKRPARFSRNWPTLEEAPEQFRVIGEQPDEVAPATSDRALAARTAQRLENLEIPYKINFSFGPGGRGLLCTDLYPSLDLLSDPLAHNQFHSSWGYHTIRVGDAPGDYYYTVGDWAICEFAERAKNNGRVPVRVAKILKARKAEARRLQ